MSRIDEIELLNNYIKEVSASLFKYEVNRNQEAAKLDDLQKKIQWAVEDLKIAREHFDIVCKREAIDLIEFDKGRNLVHLTEDNLQNLHNQANISHHTLKDLIEVKIPQAEASLVELKKQLNEYGKLILFKKP